MPSLNQLPSLLEALRSAGLLRLPDDGGIRSRLEGHFGAEFINASSNDYLGLGRGGVVSRETSAAPLSPPPHAVSRETPAGSGSSRLLHGTHDAHLRVESEVASWLGFPSALLFSSGYAANVGALAALLDHNDLVVSDTLNHASLIDGIRLSRAEVAIVPHLDLAAVAAALERPSRGGRWVVVESYYSMDGTSPDLPALRQLCDEQGAHLYVDEAHAFGLFGPHGAGLAAAAGIRADVTMAAFGKAVGSQGAAIASSEEVRLWLWNRARSFVFSTAPSPLHAFDVHSQLVRAYAEDAARQRLDQVCSDLRRRLLEAGLPLVPGSHGPILGLLTGTPGRTLELTQHLADQGILAQAIRPPTVPAGQARLRVTVTAALSEASLARLADELIRAFREVA